MGGGNVRVFLNRGSMLRWATLWCALAFVALQFAGMRLEPPFNDSYRYGMATLEILGVPQQEAHEQNVRMICKRIARSGELGRTVDPIATFDPPRLDAEFAGCLVALATPEKIWPNSPRYNAIFASRPGFPLLAAPWVKILGLDRGMFVTSWLLGAAGGILVYLLLRLVRASRAVALSGQLLYYALPVGYWAGRTLTEGPMLLTTLATVIGAWLLLQRRFKLGATVMVGAQLVGFLVKYSQVTILSLTLLGAAVAIWLFDRERRHFGTVLLAAGSIVGLAASAVLPRLFGWPGFSESLQDTFTNHFSGPDVAEPWYRFVMFNKAYWTIWVQDQANRPLLLLVTIAGAVALWRWQRSLALLVVAAGLTGIITEIAHPMWAEGDRLYTQVWLIAVVGLPLLWSVAQRSLTPPVVPSGAG